MTYSYIKVFIPSSWTSRETEHCSEGEKLLILEGLEKQRKKIREEGKREERPEERSGYKISLPEEYLNQVLAPNSLFSNEFL